MDIYDILEYWGFALVFIAPLLLIAERVFETLFLKKCGARKYGLVWLPIGRQYVLGQTADMYENRNFRRIYPIAKGISCFVGVGIMFTFILAIIDALDDGISFFGEIDETTAIFGVIGVLLFWALLETAVSIFGFFVFYKIFCLKGKERGVLWFILFAVAEVIDLAEVVLIIFMCVNMKKPNEPKFPGDSELNSVKNLTD